MKKERLLICGAFDFVHQATGGQPVKSRQLYYVLCNLYGKEQVSYSDTLLWRRNPIKQIGLFLYNALRSDKIIMLPAHNGVVFLSLLLLTLNIFKTKTLYYDVIGGWLADKLKENNSLRNRLGKFDGIWVETSSMRHNLIELGLNNVFILRNFKDLKPINNNEISQTFKEPFKLCMFSRVMAEKGVEDAILAVSKINKQYGRDVFLLDIYGPVDDSFSGCFDELLQMHQAYVKYNGEASPQDSVKILKSYFALLFPTHFYTEGIPGTIIDSYCAGVPVVSAKWVNSADLIEDGKTGFVYEFGNFDEFVSVLCRIADNPKELISLKKNCLIQSYYYTPDGIMDDLKTLLNYNNN